MQRTFRTLTLLAVTGVAMLSPTARAQSGDQIKLGTDLVEVRAVVTDAHGRPVLGLTKADFEVIDGGRAQELNFFTQERVPSAPAASTGGASDAEAPALPPVRTIVLFVDDLHLAPLSLAHVREALETFVTRDLSDRDLLGIVTASGRVRLFGQFGADRSVLRAAIAAIPLGPRDSWPARFTPYLAALIRQDPRDESTALDFGARLLKLQERSGSSGAYEDVAVDRSYREQAKQVSREVLLAADVRRRATLDAIKIVCDQLADLPGQRLVIDYTDGFTLRDFDGLPSGDELRVVASHAARAGVVVNTVVATGLEVESGVSADVGGLRDSRDYANFIDFERNAHRDAEDGPAGLASATGGELVADANDLAARARDLLAHNDAYYAIAYYSPDAASTEFRKVEVRVRNHPDYTVRAQGGYIPTEGPGPSPSASSDPTTRLAGSILRPDPPRALTVSLKAATIEPADGKRSTVKVAAVVTGDGLNLAESAGRFDVDVDVATVVFDLAGKLVFASSDHVGGSLSPEDAEAATETGLRYSTDAGPLEPGVYQLRVAFQDKSTGRLGARAVWIRVPSIIERSSVGRTEP